MSGNMHWKVLLNEPMLDIKVFIYGMLMHLQNNIAIHALLRIFQHPCYVYERLYVLLLLINISLYNT